MRVRENPFPYGRELWPGELVDREAELETVLRTLENRGKIFLIGPRRFGKTSLLRVVEERARDRSIKVLRFDAEKYETLDLLAQAIVTGAARALEGNLDRLAELLRSAAAALRPVLKIGEDGLPTVGFGVEGGRERELPILADALDSVEAMAAKSGHRVGVVLDEVQQVVVDHGLAAEKQLRATVQKHRQVGYVFAGSATRLLNEMTSQPDRPFYRLGSRLFLGPVPRDAFMEALRRHFESSGYSVAPGACERLLDLAEDVPHNVQRLAYGVWEELRVARRPDVTADSVAEALDLIVRMEDPAYTQIWNSLSRNQKKTLKAVIELGGERLHSAEASRRFGIPTSSLQVALAQLVERQLLRQEHSEGNARYRLVDPFIGAWLRRVQAI